MNTRPDNAEELKQCIEKAFADAVYPGDHNIATNHDCCEECRDTDDFFRGKHWRELCGANQKLQTGWGGLSLLSPEAWRFYIPAYLLVGLGEGEYVEDAAMWALIALSPELTGSLAGYFRERASGFTLAQQECIAAYAAAFSKLEPEDEDYEVTATYWSNKAAETRAGQG